MLDLIFCLPVLVGCQTKVKPEGDTAPRICPRCNNAAVYPAKSRMWFELCFVPLVPMKSKRVWICPICQWQLPIQPGWQPPVVGEQQYYPQQQQAFMSPQAFQPGYAPAYPPQAGYQSPQPTPGHKQM
ncbi:hypothetical protein PsYK624_070090 [Phanerochaete sordida]|uniref:Zinc-ribbon 15 domain-containing protein n=1 Tax=Phanerochaete sordida TaxID=48140 RepID=A0A9P3LD43_9APHY|nr:hypothetical protein PsYK624_070090 [Phanerochaete sordida]